MVCVQAAPAAEAAAGEDGEGRSARKRRRLRISPLRSASQHPQQHCEAGEQAPAAAQQLQPAGPGLAAVAAGVARMAADLQQQCWQQGPAPESIAALAALLGLLAPLMPREATAMALAALPAPLRLPTTAGSEEGAQLAALLRLTLATLQAALVEASAGATSAAVALASLSSPQLLALLRRGVSSGGAAPAEDSPAAAAAAAENCRLALAAGLAAVQAELLDPADILELLQTALAESGGAGDGSGDGSGGAASAASPVAAAAALLLPAAACIGGNKEHPMGSQPRGTQGGRSKKHAAVHHPPPSPLVTALQGLLGEQGRAPAVLAAAAHGLLCVARHAHEPIQLAQVAIDAAVGGHASSSSSGGACGLGQLLQSCGCSAAEGAAATDFHPSLTAGVSEWVRLALEQLTGAELTAEGQVRCRISGWLAKHADGSGRQGGCSKLVGRAALGSQHTSASLLCWLLWRPQVALVEAVAAFLQRSAQGQLEHSRGLVQWLLRAAASPAAPVRSAVLRCAPLFAEPQVGPGVLLLSSPERGPSRLPCLLAVCCRQSLPPLDAAPCRRLPSAPFPPAQVVLALCHEGPHPIHTKDREAAVEALEAQARAVPCLPACLVAGKPLCRTLSLALCFSGTLVCADRLTPHSLLSQMLQALREALEAAAPASGSGGGSTGESVREGLVQVSRAAVWCRVARRPLLLPHVLPGAAAPLRGLRSLSSHLLSDPPVPTRPCADPGLRGRPHAVTPRAPAAAGDHDHAGGWGGAGGQRASDPGMRSPRGLPCPAGFSAGVHPSVVSLPTGVPLPLSYFTAGPRAARALAGRRVAAG